MNRALLPDELTPADARALQQQLRAALQVTPLPPDVRLVAGADLAYAHDGRCWAALVVVDASTLETVEAQVATAVATFPYVPGLLSFRELPALALAWEQLRARPDVLLCDGQGYAHPRRCGLACHAGLLFDVPSLGCAKTRLIGEHPALGPEPGEQVPLCDGDELIGAVLRTRRGCRPLYLSTGHRVTLPDAVALVQRLLTRYRQPEPTRRAHALVTRAREAARCDCS
ncbi:MAG: deoxyribonuclease V [Fimbriimonadaceae bacterium]|nr:deoxyribonuclease V [Fimbriimonadaceae bacterium]